MDILSQPMPWYIAGPIIGLTVPVLLLLGGKMFGVSANLRHTCAACNFGNIEFFNYDWKKAGSWNLVFLVGSIIGGFLGGYIFANPEPINLASSTITDLKALGINDFSGMVPTDLISWDVIGTPAGLTVMVLGGFLVGFGARYAGGCTSGHAISGLSDLQLASLVAVIGFFIGGLLMTYLIYPLIL
ncbi:YeeE/YedE family protein [Gracilimonas tropica]|uniref:YeeE/YedE family protein n=1 Tax=Gracilimonas tropica TaxID=454600 RepID=UPI00035F0273|nr:YeeE/YedE thiosulfate transporter family protein [Gracilimonas tropica]